MQNWLKAQRCMKMNTTFCISRAKSSHIPIEFLEIIYGGFRIWILFDTQKVDIFSFQCILLSPRLNQINSEKLPFLTSNKNEWSLCKMPLDTKFFFSKISVFIINTLRNTTQVYFFITSFKQIEKYKKMEKDRIIILEKCYFARALFVPSLPLLTKSLVFLLGSSNSITSNNNVGYLINVCLHSLMSILSKFWLTKSSAWVFRVKAWYISPSSRRSKQFPTSILEQSFISQSSFNPTIWYWLAAASNSLALERVQK